MFAMLMFARDLTRLPGSNCAGCYSAALPSVSTHPTLPDVPGNNLNHFLILLSLSLFLPSVSTHPILPDVSGHNLICLLSPIAKFNFSRARFVSESSSVGLRERAGKWLIALLKPTSSSATSNGSSIQQ